MQIASIQILRFVAALGVAVAHLQGNLRHLSLPTLPDGFVIGAAGVDLFFVISGFVIVYSSENLFGRSDAPLYFFLRRAARIWPMYAAFTLAITAYLLYQHGTLEIAGHSWASLAASLAFIPFVNLHGTTTPIYGVGWTLNFEMFFYLLFACLVWLPRLWATTAAATVLLTLVLAGRLEMIPGPYNLLTSTMVLEFAYGALIALMYRYGIRLPFALTATLGLGGVALLGWSAWAGLGDADRAIAWGIPAASLVASVTLTRRRLPQGSRLIWLVVLLGDASYAMYLVHPLALGAAKRLLPSMLEPFPLLYSTASIAICIGAALLVHVLAERPTTRAIQRYINSVTRYGQARQGRAAVAVA